jgi:hypothetical protein
MVPPLGARGARSPRRPAPVLAACPRDAVAPDWAGQAHDLSAPRAGADRARLPAGAAHAPGAGGADRARRLAHHAVLARHARRAVRGARLGGVAPRRAVGARVCSDSCRCPRCTLGAACGLEQRVGRATDEASRSVALAWAGVARLAWGAGVRAVPSIGAGWAWDAATGTGTTIAHLTRAALRAAPSRVGAGCTRQKRGGGRADQ